MDRSFDESTDPETAPRDDRHGWPGVAGFSHDGETYCTDCAEDDPRIDTGPESDAAILARTEWDRRPACGTCGRYLPDLVILDPEDGGR